MSSSSAPMDSRPSIRRSSRTSPFRKQSHMIESPSDSRRSVRRREEDPESDSSVSIYQRSSKRKRSNTITSDVSEHSTSQRPRNKSKNPRQSSKKTSESKKRASQPEESSQGLILKINLRQDSEEENEKVKMKEIDPYDPVRDYYENYKTIINASTFSLCLLFHHRS